MNPWMAVYDKWDPANLLSEAVSL